MDSRLRWVLRSASARILSPGPMKTKPKHLSAEIRRYLAHNGRRGGKAGKGSPARRAAAIQAAEARWKGRRKAASKTAAP